MAAIRSGDKQLVSRLLAEGANRGVRPRAQLPTRYADVAIETRVNDTSPWRKCTHDGRRCYVHNLKDSEGNDLRDDDFTLGRPQWHWWALPHSAHPVAKGVSRTEELSEHEFAQLLKKAKAADEQRRTRAIRALWWAALKSNGTIARRAASMPKAGQHSGWRGGRQLKTAQLKVRSLNAYEFGKFADAALFGKPRLATRFFQLLDADGDGELSTADWDAAIELLCSPDRSRRVSFLFDLIDPCGSGQLCQAQTTGRDRFEGRQIDEPTVDYFFRKFLVARDDTVDIVLASVERYFGLAPANTAKRGDGRKVTGAHLGMLGTHRPTARAVGLADPGNQGLCDEQGLEHADFFRPTDKQERLDRARKQLGRHDARYRAASTATIELRELLSQHAERLLSRSRKRLARDVFEAADLDRSGAIDRSEFNNYILADPRLLQWLEDTGSWWIELGGLVAAREAKEDVSVGTMGLTGLDIFACAGEGSYPSTVLLQEALQPHLSQVSFNKLLALQKQAVKEGKTALTRSEWLSRSATAGVRHVRLAEALFDVWTTREGRGSNPSTEKVQRVEVQVGNLLQSSMLHADQQLHHDQPSFISTSSTFCLVTSLRACVPCVYAGARLRTGDARPDTGGRLSCDHEIHIRTNRY